MSLDGFITRPDDRPGRRRRVPAQLVMGGPWRPGSRAGWIATGLVWAAMLSGGAAAMTDPRTLTARIACQPGTACPSPQTLWGARRSAWPVSCSDGSGSGQGQPWGRMIDRVPPSALSHLRAAVRLAGSARSFDGVPVSPGPPKRFSSIGLDNCSLRLLMERSRDDPGTLRP